MKKACNRGFTLVEIIISIVILGLITLIISSGFRLGLNAWDKGEAETAATQRLRVLSGLLSQQLKSAYPYKAEVEGEKVVIFKGEEDSIMFVTTLTDLSDGGFKWVRYSFKDGTLFYKEGILPDKEFEDKLTGDEDIVDSEVGDVKFSYFTSDAEDSDGDDWEKSSDYGRTLPSAVKVRISYFQPFVINIPMGVSEEIDEDEIS